MCEIKISSGIFQNKSHLMMNERNSFKQHNGFQYDSNRDGFENDFFFFKRRDINRLGIYWGKIINNLAFG